jgi:hypothetical protein
MERQMKKHSIILIIIVGLIGLGTLCCRPSKEADTFYLRANKTGRLIGPISLTPGHTLPQLDEQTYIVADPTESELKIRKCLLETLTYENHYIDCPINHTLETINHMLERRLGNKAPPVRFEDVDGFVPSAIMMDLTEVPAYDALCDIAAKAKVRIFIEDGTVVLSAKPLRKMINESTRKDLQ